MSLGDFLNDECESIATCPLPSLPLLGRLVVPGVRSRLAPAALAPAYVSDDDSY